MSYEVLIPQLSFSMTEGTITEWLKSDGDQVTEGEALFLIEADKSNVEVPAPATGTLQVTGVVGEMYDVGTVIGTIG